MPIEDAVFNVAHAALLMIGLARADLDLVGRGLADRLHQPRRAHLYPRSMELLGRARELGALGATISGAGPTVLALVALRGDRGRVRGRPARDGGLGRRPARAVRVDGGGRPLALTSCGVRLAATRWTRLRGLLGRDAPGALLIAPARSVHTCGMRFPIDVVFLDERLTVVRVVRALRPWRVAGERRARAVLELPAGGADGIEVGVRLRLRP